MSIEAKYANQDLDSKALKSISVTCLKTVYWMKLRANPQPSLFSEPPWQPHGKRRMPWGHTWKSALDLPAITRRHLHYLVSAQAFSISNQLFRKYLAHAWHTCSHPPFRKRHIYVYIYIRRYVYLVLSRHPSQTNQARRHAILDTRLGV